MWGMVVILNSVLPMGAAAGGAIQRQFGIAANGMAAQRLIALNDQGRPVGTDDLGEALEEIDCITDTFNALLRLVRLEVKRHRAT
ncbi:MAG: hypothetical protein AAF580_15590 [Pseudomonadota bacterium]